MLRAPFSSEFDPSEEAGVSDRAGEAPFLRKLSGRAPAELKQLLTAIDAYRGVRPRDYRCVQWLADTVPRSIAGRLSIGEDFPLQRQQRLHLRRWAPALPVLDYRRRRGIQDNHFRGADFRSSPPEKRLYATHFCRRCGQEHHPVTLVDDIKSTLSKTRNRRRPG